MFVQANLYGKLALMPSSLGIALGYCTAVVGFATPLMHAEILRRGYPFRSESCV